MNRRDFFGRFGLGLGGVALAGLFNSPAQAARTAVASANPYQGLPGFPNFAPKAKRVIYLFMSGGPSQMDLFDYKPKLNEMNGQELPPSVRMGQRLTGMSANQSSLPLAGSAFRFQQHGQCGAWVSELLPHTAKIVDDLCFIKSLHTEAINHPVLHVGESEVASGVTVGETFMVEAVLSQARLRGSGVRGTELCVRKSPAPAFS